jgi:hypothetical protein
MAGRTSKQMASPVRGLGRPAPGPLRWEGRLAWWGGSMMLTVAIIGFVAAIVMPALVTVKAASSGPRTDGAYGQIDIPGAKRVHLPRGNLNLYFAAVTGALSTPIPELSLGVHAIGHRGPDPTITDDLGATNLYNGEAVIRVAKLEVPRRGDYRIAVSGQVTGYLQPRLLLGRDPPSPPVGASGWGFARIMTLTGIAEVGILLASLVALAVGRRRQHERVAARPPVPDPGPPRIERQTFDSVQIVNARGAEPAELIKKLARLRAQGLITDQQFKAAKQEVESGGSTASRHPT